MKVYKTTVTIVFHTTEADVVEHFGPGEKDIQKDPNLRNETPEMMIKNQLQGMRDINEEAWEPHALPPEFKSKIEVVDVPDDEVQRIQTFYRTDGEGGVEIQKRPDDDFIARDLEKLGNE